MTEASAIVCKPTPWFTMRALIIIVMFGIFAFMFYRDGSVGYREKNLVYYLHPVFEKANQQFVSMNAGDSLTASKWQAFAREQTVPLPAEPVLPVGTKQPMPWPDLLHDFDKMKDMKWHDLWLEYSGGAGLDQKWPEHPYDARKIKEQWVVFWVCLSFVLVASFFLIRTTKRSIIANEESITSAEGKRIAYDEMTRIDLRKWETKGLAFIDYESGNGSGRVRIDGLTYGGFKEENGEPAERLMKKIREKFRGEIIEYVSLSETEADDAGETAEKDESG